MNKDEFTMMGLFLSPAIAAALIFFVTDVYRTKRAIACIEAGMEWIDGDCMKGETK